MTIEPILYTTTALFALAGVGVATWSLRRAPAHGDGWDLVQVREPTVVTSVRLPESYIEHWASIYEALDLWSMQIRFDTFVQAPQAILDGLAMRAAFRGEAEALLADLEAVRAALAGEEGSWA